MGVCHISKDTCAHLLDTPHTHTVTPPTRTHTLTPGTSRPRAAHFVPATLPELGLTTSVF